MCRLLGVVASEATNLPTAIGAPLEKFIELSKVHKDGWGAAWLADDGVQTVRGVPAAGADPQLWPALEQAVAKQIVLHLRWATPGMTVNINNCHPFTDGEIAFAHNGSFTPTEQLRKDLLDWDAWAPQGTTDSELYFSLVRHLHQTMTWPQAFRMAIARIVADEKLQEIPGLPGLNAMLITPDEGLIVVSHNDVARLFDFESEDYYQLWIRRDPDKVIISSSNWDLPDHQLLENMRIYHVKPDLTIDEYPIA